MYNWDDPINDALSKPDIVPEKKVHEAQNIESISNDHIADSNVCLLYTSPSPRD